MKKVSYNNLAIRIFHLIVGVVLLLVLSYLVNIFNLTLGAIILIMFWSLLLILIVFFNCFDWDIYTKRACLILKRFGTTYEICDLKFTIKSIPLLTIFFNLYLIHFENGQKFIFKHQPVKLKFFSSSPLNTKHIEDDFKANLNL